MATLGTALLGQKATDALALELGTELVVGGPGHAEARCCLGDGSAVGAHTPYHFVANLHEVAAVEEVAAGEDLVFDGRGVGVESADASQGIGLGIG